MNNVTKPQPNVTSGQFRILGACSECSHVKWLDSASIPESTDINKLHVPCDVCGSQDFVIRIVYVGGGEHSYV